MAIERTADNVARAFLLERRLFEEGFHQQFEGEVTGLIGAGAFVAFDGFEGLLPVRRLHGLVAARRARDDAVATRVRQAPAARRRVVVQVEKVDAPRGRVDLIPVEL